ncbi:MAG: hypothetical protein ACQESM_02165 [Bacteroidota bacterium]
MKKVILLIIMIIPVITIGQEEDWKLFKESNGVMIYQMDKIWEDPSEGINQEMVLLKFVNTTDQKLHIEWYEVRWQGDNCRNCDSYKDPEYKHELTLEPGESIEGKCSFESPDGLAIFKRFVERDSVEPLSKFELRDLTVNPEN